MSMPAATVGGAFLAALFTYKSKFPSSLFSYHPTLLGVGWLALSPLALQYLRESKKTTDKKEKEGKVQMHAYINAAVQLCAYGGAWAIYRNKEIMAASKGQVAKHLVSPHGKLGAISTGLMFLSAAFAAYKTMLSNKGGPDYLWRDKVHKYLGMLSYVTSGMAILAIVNGPWGKSNLGGPAGQRLVSAAIFAVQGMVAAPWLGITN